MAEQVVMTEFASVHELTTPSEMKVDVLDKQLPFREANVNIMERSIEEVSGPGPEIPADLEIETGTGFELETCRELKFENGPGMGPATNMNELSNGLESTFGRATTAMLDASGLPAGPHLPRKISLSPSEYELRMESKGKRRRLYETPVLVAIIALVWMLMLIPVIVYHLPSEAATERNRGAMQTACSSPEVYSGICQGFLQQQQTCLGVTGDTILVPQGRGDEAEAVLFLNGLPAVLTLSPECDEVIEGFLCYFIFGLCDDTGSLHLPSSEDCRILTEETCSSELEQAMRFIEGIPDIQLPQCDTLPATSSECAGNGSNTTSSVQLSIPTQSNNQTVNASNQSLMCSEGFYVGEFNGFNVCRPECGEWKQFPDGVIVAVDVIIILQAVTYLVSGTLVIVFSVIQYKRMFKFPNILIVYGIITLGVYECFLLMGSFDRKVLFCSSIDLNDTVNNPTAFCSIQGAVLYYASLLQTTYWCCHIVMVFFSLHFPFRAKYLEKNGYFTYIHIIVVIVALALAAVPVAAAFGTGGFVVSRFPTINCFAANVDVTFYCLELPLSILLATGCSLTVLIFYKVLLVVRRQREDKKKGLRMSLMDRLHINPAELKVLVIFVYSFIFAAFGVIGFTIGARNINNFISELMLYFACEATGINVNEQCERSYSFVQIEVPADLAWVLLGLYPVVNLVYVINVRDIKKTVSKRWDRGYNVTQITRTNTEYL